MQQETVFNSFNWAEYFIPSSYSWSILCGQKREEHNEALEEYLKFIAFISNSIDLRHGGRGREGRRCAGDRLRMVGRLVVTQMEGGFSPSYSNTICCFCFPPPVHVLGNILDLMMTENRCGNFRYNLSLSLSLFPRYNSYRPSISMPKSADT